MLARNASTRARRSIPVLAAFRPGGGLRAAAPRRPARGGVGVLVQRFRSSPSRQSHNAPPAATAAKNADGVALSGRAPINPNPSQREQRSPSVSLGFLAPSAAAPGHDRDSCRRSGSARRPAPGGGVGASQASCVRFATLPARQLQNSAPAAIAARIWLGLLPAARPSTNPVPSHSWQNPASSRMELIPRHG